MSPVQGEETLAAMLSVVRTNLSRNAQDDRRYCRCSTVEPKPLSLKNAAPAAKDFVFCPPSQTAVLRGKTRSHWRRRWRSDAASDVAAVSRGFSRPHRSSNRNYWCIRAGVGSACVKRHSIVRLACACQGRPLRSSTCDSARRTVAAGF